MYSIHHLYTMYMVYNRVYACTCTSVGITCTCMYVLVQVRDREGACENRAYLTCYSTQDIH